MLMFLGVLLVVQTRPRTGCIRHQNAFHGAGIECTYLSRSLHVRAIDAVHVIVEIVETRSRYRPRLLRGIPASSDESDPSLMRKYGYYSWRDPRIPALVAPADRITAYSRRLVSSPHTSYDAKKRTPFPR
ncbi:hypothetical protein EXIGLDRAFT_778299 [Exidia glandulosa HHB12029]|uniref:Secreted protein n=1 Tax=Exidia glandulosa HHB12029 TaxID=1314781 RepID=A0A165CLT4_EXIGL|nr:hypothetical protein EXIGLDRAFT_778299 [Exidia glandulosa HHB12029]